MRLPPLHRATLLRRYKRFLADVRFEDGREETVHVPNPGAMLGLAEPGMTVWTSLGTSRTRKLAHTLELVEADGVLVCVNTLTPNRLVAEALAQCAIPELAGYPRVRPEAPYGEASRVDFLLETPEGARLWLEVKGVTLRRERGLAEWPDCVSARGARHLKDLAAKAREGDRSAILFVVLRADCDRFAVAADLDPAFAAGMAAYRGDVEVLCYACDIDLRSIHLRRPVVCTGRP